MVMPFASTPRSRVIQRYDVAHTSTLTRPRLALSLPIPRVRVRVRQPTPRVQFLLRRTRRPPTTLMSTEPRVLIDNRYELLVRVGRGATGEVYKARDIAQTRRDAFVAVKLVDLEDAEDEVADIQREIGILAQCASPYVTKYLGSALVQGTSKLAIVMEYMAGGSARHLVDEAAEAAMGDGRGKGLDEGEISFITRDVLRALEYLHAEGKIHRDVKAANVLLTAEAEARLADFGVSGQMTHTLGARRKTFTGTPFWMAPEVIQGGDGYDEKADIWSLGITCYELATGSAPHADLHPMRVLFVIPKEEAPRLPDDGAFSDLFRDFVAQCLHKDAASRPSAAELLEHPFVTQFDGNAVDKLKTRVDKHIILTEGSINNASPSDALQQKETSASAPVWDFGDDSLGRKFSNRELSTQADVRSEHDGSAPSVYQSMGGTIRMANPPSISTHTDDVDSLASMENATIGTMSSHGATTTHQHDKLDELLDQSIHVPLMQSLISPAFEAIETKNDETADTALKCVIDALERLEVASPGSLTRMVQSLIRELARGDDESLRYLKAHARRYFGGTTEETNQGLPAGGRSVIANYLLHRWSAEAS